MSTDSSDKTTRLLANPLPIVMLVLLTAGVIVKNVPLESVRPADPERVKYMSTSNHQDVEARLWQDPFAAMEKHEKSFRDEKQEKCSLEEENKNCVSGGENKHPHTVNALHERINKGVKSSPFGHDDFTVVAVSVFGGSFVEAAEYRRRSRFAVISALGFHNYYPENAHAIGYFETTLKPGMDSQKLMVPYEWYKRKDGISNVLVLWLDEEKFTNMDDPPLNALKALFNEVAPPQCTANGKGLNFKLVGPAGSEMLIKLMEKEKPVSNHGNSIDLRGGNTLQVFSPNATISVEAVEQGLDVWELDHSSKKLGKIIAPWIVRTIGTDKQLSLALVWELWQRGVNRYNDSWWQQKWQQFVNNEKLESSMPKCKDGIVLISEQDSKYARTLSQNLTDHFSSLCETDSNVTKPPIRTFSYLRGLDGVLPDTDKSGTKASHKEDSKNQKDLGAQFSEVPKEHAEGRSQYDYLRRLADEITQLNLNRDKQFADNGIKAIGIVGSDVYDKLLILQALRNRFKDKIFFTTDLDARYLHADQQDWARNLVVASNFGLSLRPELQDETLTFRDGYQTATYLATLMAIENGVKESKESKESTKIDWADKMKEWLRPQIFEIGRTKAVHLASLKVDDLNKWYASRIKNYNSEGVIIQNEYEPCGSSWLNCKYIDPQWPLFGLSFKYAMKIIVMIVCGLVLIYMANHRFREMLYAMRNSLPPPVNAEFLKYLLASVGFLVLGGLIWYIGGLLNTSLKQGTGEPFLWLEGTSVWPGLVLRFSGFLITLVLALTIHHSMRRKAQLISRHFSFALPQTWTLARTRLSAMLTGPYLDLTSFKIEGKTGPEPVGSEGISIAILWQNYLRLTSLREMIGWVMLSMVIVVPLGVAASQVFDMPSFPHRGSLVEILSSILAFLNALILWLVIFWVGYQTRACAQFIKILSNVKSQWPEELLQEKEVETGVPRSGLVDYLDFQLVMRATQRIHRLIYLPFILILFMVIARNELFDRMNFPPILVFAIGIMLIYALSSVVLLRRCAVAARAKALDHYEMRLLRMQARPPLNDNCDRNPEDSTQKPHTDNGTRAGQTPKNSPMCESSFSVDQIKLLMERISTTRDGVFAPITEQPALGALLLPFGGFGGAQLIEYLISLTG